jgi:hypothetical protein
LPPAACCWRIPRPAPAGSANRADHEGLVQNKTRASLYRRRGFVMKRAAKKAKLL